MDKGKGAVVVGGAGLLGVVARVGHYTLPA